MNNAAIDIPRLWLWGTWNILAPNDAMRTLIEELFLLNQAYIKNLSTKLNSAWRWKKTFISSEYSFRHMCNEVVFFGAEYFRGPTAMVLKH